MRGRLGCEKWHVTHLLLGGSYMAERRVPDPDRPGCTKLETAYVDSHCLACAKSDVLAKHGGRVDLRGWMRTPCGSFLKAMQYSVDAQEVLA